jgi:predicted lipid-binding transport protein (Tim44 family)
MRKTLALFAAVLALGLTATAFDAEARRLGGARSSGLQRQAVTPPAAPSNVTRSTSQAAPATAPTAAGAAAAAPRRSWMGPIAGLAAGLGLAALASHFGFGEALANVLTIALLAMAVLFVVGFVMRKRAGQGPALAGAGGQPGPFARSQPAPMQPQGGSLIGSRIGAGLGAGLGAAAQPTASPIPADFDTAGFVRNAKSQFLALQAANDARDLDRLRDYLTPEMFEVVREEILERGTQPQRTEVFGLEAQVLEVAQESERYIVSVRFTGSVREQPGAAPEPLDEVWHLAKPRWGDGGWVIAGIQQVATE